jgi:hypothetical protein
VRAREEAIAGSMAKAGVTAHTINTAQDLGDALVEMVRQSKRRRA